MGSRGSEEIVQLGVIMNYDTSGLNNICSASEMCVCERASKRDRQTELQTKTLKACLLSTEMGENLEFREFKENLQIVSKHKQFLKVLIREVEIKTTMKYY